MSVHSYCGHQWQTQSSLLAAKTKASLLETLSRPKLGLSATLFRFQLLKLIFKPLRQLTILFDCNHTWTDSAFVLGWLSRKSSHWLRLVANRNSSELESNRELSWHRLIWEEISTDPASLGLELELKKTCNFWWHGLEWLVRGNFPDPHPIIDTNEETRKRQTFLVNTITNTKPDRDVFFHKNFCINARIKGLSHDLENKMKNFRVT